MAILVNYLLKGMMNDLKKDYELPDKEDTTWNGEPPDKGDGELGEWGNDEGEANDDRHRSQVREMPTQNIKINT